MVVNFRKLILSILILISSASFSFAQNPTNLLAFSFSDVVKEAARAVVPESIIESVIGTTTVATTTEVEDSEVAVDHTTENSCENFDDAVVNTLNLEVASADSRQKIEKIEDTINDESFFRDALLANAQSFAQFKKQEKQIFIDMKKQIANAKNYYDNVDQDVNDTNKYLENNMCDSVKIEDAINVASNTDLMVVNEAIFRKKFVANLKEKMKTLQDATKSVK